MDLLLDTHALIWFINGDEQLPDKSIKLIRNIDIKCFISIASIWEIAIKLSLGKLDLNGGFDEISRIMRRYEIELLPITFEHIQNLNLSLTAGNIPNPNYILYDQKHQPEVLQEIDQPVFIDQLTHAFKTVSLELIHFETYSIWVKDDYHFLMVQKNSPFKEVKVSDARNILKRLFDD